MGEQVPKPVKDAFEALRLTLGKKLSLHRISGHYYVYEYSTLRDATLRKTIVRTYYLGHITDDGKYIAREHRKLAGLETRRAERHQSEEYDDREGIALRNLSMNGRMSMAKLSKRIGMSVTGTRHFVKRLEEKYGIRYFASINMFELGYLRYVAFVKFKGAKPSTKELKDGFENDSNVALVAETKGKYDLMIILYLDKNDHASRFIYRWRSSNILSSYTARMYISIIEESEIDEILCRLPFLELLKDKLGDKKAILSKVEYSVLKSLSNDGHKDFTEVDKEHNLENGRSNYAFYRLKERGIINRVTITMEPPHLKYNAIFIMRTENYKLFNEYRKEWLKEIISDEKPWINKYTFTDDIGAPDSVLHIAPIFNDMELSSINEKLNSIKGTSNENLIITNVVVGAFYYRKFDFAYSKTYNILADEYKMPQSKREDYE